MNQTTRARVQARSSANSRLQAMTIGAAILGIAGTGIFSYAAAMTYTGKTATVAADDQGGAVDPNNGQAFAPDATTDPRANAQAPSVNNQAPAPTPQVRRSRHARVSTGGS